MIKVVFVKSEMPLKALVKVSEWTLSEDYFEDEASSSITLILTHTLFLSFHLHLAQNH